jgi:hypothetical protein
MEKECVQPQEGRSCNQELQKTLQNHGVVLDTKVGESHRHFSRVAIPEGAGWEHPFCTWVMGDALCSQRMCHDPLFTKKTLRKPHRPKVWPLRTSKQRETSPGLISLSMRLYMQSSLASQTVLSLDARLPHCHLLLKPPLYT